MAEVSPVLRLHNLGVSYRARNSWTPVVSDFHLQIQAGQIYGLVGESGSGKSTVASAIMRFLPANGRVEPGSQIELLGEDILAKSQAEMRHLWATNLNLVPQNPGAALNPSMRVGEQAAEIIRLHGRADRVSARMQVINSFERVHLPDPALLYDRYPHQLSGGQQQRVTIAMALITSPQLLILDEPTTNLDVTTEATTLSLVKTLIGEEQTGALYITHNLGVVAQLCNRVTVLYAGEIMEDGPVEAIFNASVHPYTLGLLRSTPRLGQTKRSQPLVSIPGQPPLPGQQPQACVFSPRCPLAIDICTSTKPLLEAPELDRLVRCHRWREIAGKEIQLEIPDETIRAGDAIMAERPTALKVDQLVKDFPTPRSLAHIVRGAPPSVVRAVDHVTLQVRQGRTYGLVGESGSGKTTLSRVIIGLLEPTSGQVEFMGAELQGTVQERSREVLAQLQMVFQNPQNSLNPYHTVGQAIRRPLMKLARLNCEEAEQQTYRLLAAVNLHADYVDRYPDTLSGGEKQRVAIARAFASDPSLVICDEPVSSLDASVQSTVLNLLAQLQDEHGTSYLFISHDLAVVGYLADYVAVMYLGELFEVGYAQDLFSPPLHPYTEALISAIPVPDPQQRTERIQLTGDIPSPRHKPTGCAFHTRCPHKLGAICEQEAPPWHGDGKEHFIRCHRTPEELAQLQAYLL